ncbi:PAAR domain-containing protein [Proteus mirabilis]|uniref:PAAR domain-containing protein n=1 Tax=Proteus mirabilis TaxID=584 RepID=UPI001BB0BA7C|nr:PAAR domain-containing protein [Proteus mirabilis]MBS3832872.1 PAAR domain-containing protein [Proteus mirabilis]MCT0075328.1 PAAR domain-containing protein [Proteus mirabilis]MDF7283011.1 PAAR domain-containing protein [Proteus mirabilis]MDF7376041.1 PAAR domain-containing protein [Proteus mirabilis]
MPTIILIGDSDTGHDNHGPTKAITGSSTVKVDGKAVARLGDTLAPHGEHSRTIISGSNSVFIDGKPAARAGDTISCGGVLIGNASVKVG